MLKTPLHDSTNRHHPKSAGSSRSDKSGTTPKFPLVKSMKESPGFLHTSNLNRLKSPVFSLKNFEIGKTLGKGKLGKVYCVLHKPSNFVCALKVMDLSQLKSLNLIKNLKREIEIQSNLNHKNILKCFNYFKTSNKVYLILEYCIYGELYHHLKINKRFSNQLASYYIYQITLALSYLHSNNIIHRDLKPENILVDFNHTIKLSDFGWSVQLQNNNKRSTICGTLDYLSPEMINSVSYDFKSDVWSLGVLIYELLVGVPPFEHADRNVTYKKIVRLDYHFPKFINSDAQDLIVRLLKINPNERIPLEEVLTHPWILKNKANWPAN